MKCLDMEIRQNDRDYLAVLESEEGSATTTEIRKQTDMDNRQVNYRHDKLARENIVSLEVDNSLTPDGAAGMRVATLTDKGWKLIREGEAAEGEVQQTIEEQVEELAEQVEEVEETMDGAIPWMNEMSARVRRIEAFLEERGADLDEYADVEDFQ